MRIALILEYEGTNYHGSQVQGRVPTIQGELEHALKAITVEDIRTAFAGRTDQGVHAKGQVVAFTTDSSLTPKAFTQALNHHLAEDIAVKDAFEVSSTFDPRRDALSREYCYRIWNSESPSPLVRRSAYQVRRPLGIDEMNQACQILMGTHDFAPFASSLEGRENTVRTMYRAEVVKEGELVNCYLVANAFLPHQVRHTVGALVNVGLGKSDTMEFGQLLKSKRPSAAGPALPPHGLCLMKVNYPGDVQ